MDFCAHCWVYFDRPLPDLDGVHVVGMLDSNVSLSLRVRLRAMICKILVVRGITFCAHAYGVDGVQTSRRTDIARLAQRMV